MATVVQLQYELDLRSLQTQYQQVVDKLNKIEGAADKAGKTGTDAFKKHGESVKGLSNIMESYQDLLKDVGTKVALAFSAEKVIEFGKESLEAYNELAQGEAKLLNALKGRSDIQERLISQAEDIQSKTIIPHDAIIAQQAYLASQGRTEQQIRKTVDAAVQLSAVTGDSLEDAVKKLDATMEGNIGRLGKLDRGFKDLSLTQLKNGEAIDLVLQKYSGFAETAAETGTGPLIQLKNKFKEFSEGVGSALMQGIEGLMGFAEFVGNGFRMPIEHDIDATKNKFKGLEEEVKKLSLMTLGGELDTAKMSNEELQDAIQKTTKLISLQGKQFQDNANNPYMIKYQENLKQLNEELNKRKEEKAPVTKSIQELNQELQNAKTAYEQAAIGSKAFTEAQKEVQRLEKELSKYQVKSADDVKKAQDEQLRKFKEHFDFRKKIEQDGMDSEFDAMVSRWDGENQKIAENEKDQQDWADFNKEIGEQVSKDHLQAAKDQIEADKKKAETRKQLEQEVLATAIQAADAIFEYRAQQRQAELEQVGHSMDEQYNKLEDQKKKGLISDKAYQAKKDALDKEKDQKVKQARIDAAKADKEDAMFKVALESAVAIAKTFAELGVPAAWPFVGILAAQLAIQEALIASRPLPKYAKGTKGKPGSGLALVGEQGPETVFLPDGAKVLPNNRVKQYSDVLDAMFDGRFDKLYMPRIEAYELAQKRGTADRMWASMGMQRFSDKNIVEAINKSKVVSLDDKTIKKLTGNNRRDRAYKR